MTDPILLELNLSGVAVLTVNRPEVRNALNWAAMHTLRSHVEQLEAVPDLRVVIMTGAGGRSFISGGDLRDLHSTMGYEDGLRQHDLMNETLERLAALPVPVIAALEGSTRGGGCEVALACDLRIAAEDATLGFAQVDMGVTPGWGGAQRLSAVVGYSKALHLMVTGTVLEADEALTLGLINEVVPSGGALKRAQEIGQSILSKPPLAVRGIKAVLHGYRMLGEEAGHARERDTFATLWATEDHGEASTAFLEKRQPRFKGK